MVDCRRSAVVNNAALVLNHNQLSFIPWPIVLEPLSASYSARLLSYSSRVIFAFTFAHRLVFAGLFVFALTSTALVFLLAFATLPFAFEFAVNVSHPFAIMTTKNAAAINPNKPKLRMILPPVFSRFV